MRNSPLFLFIGFIIMALLFITGGYLLGQKGLNISDKKIGPSVPNALFFTNPAIEFTGKIDKISGDSIWISGKYAVTPPPTPPNAPTNIPGSIITVPPLPPSKIFTYKVNIALYTIINRSSTPVTFLFKKITPTPTPKLTIKDIRVGQIVTVFTGNDLRTLNSDEFEAYSVKLPPVVNTITGKIADIKTKEGIIILKAIPPQPAGDKEPTPDTPKEVEYAISVGSDTEISRMGLTETPKGGATPKPPQPVSYQITDLKKDIQITLYTESDVTESQRLNALRIEPPADLIPSTKSALTPTPKSTVTPKT